MFVAVQYLVLLLYGISTHGIEDENQMFPKMIR